MPDTMVASFVLRFVRRIAATNDLQPDDQQAAWRGVIRHVQSNQELHFHHMPDALQFVARFVDVREPAGEAPGQTLEYDGEIGVTAAEDHDGN